MVDYERGGNQLPTDSDLVLCVRALQRIPHLWVGPVHSATLLRLDRDWVAFGAERDAKTGVLTAYRELLGPESQDLRRVLLLISIDHETPLSSLVSRFEEIRHLLNRQGLPYDVRVRNCHRVTATLAQAAGYTLPHIDPVRYWAPGLSSPLLLEPS
jgi:hypothetical protein